GAVGHGPQHDRPPQDRPPEDHRPDRDRRRLRHPHAEARRGLRDQEFPGRRRRRGAGPAAGGVRRGQIRQAGGQPEGEFGGLSGGHGQAVSEAAVREAFALQGAICTAAGAPFTGRVCRMLGEKLDRHTAIGRRVLDWPGVPTHDGDALALRLAGGLHALARSRQGDLAAFYPPNTPPRDDAVLWRAIHAALLRDAETLDGWLDGPPQTNEVGRSSALMAGLLVLADRFGLPFALYELGASAGLNTILDRYGFQLGRTRAGAADSP